MQIFTEIIFLSQAKHTLLNTMFTVNSKAYISPHITSLTSRYILQSQSWLIDVAWVHISKFVKCVTDLGENPKMTMGIFKEGCIIMFLKTQKLLLWRKTCLLTTESKSNSEELDPEYFQNTLTLYLLVYFYYTRKRSMIKISV